MIILLQRSQQQTRFITKYGHSQGVNYAASGLRADGSAVPEAPPVFKQ